MRRILFPLLAAVALAFATLGIVRAVAQPKAAPPKEAVKLQESVDTYKNKLMRDGSYMCCVAPSCDYCATHKGKCTCLSDLTNGKPVCRECKGGWHAGEGILPGRKAADVKVLPSGKGE